jgi:hypothetical protein
VLCQTSTKVLGQVRGAIHLAGCLSQVGTTPPASLSASLTPAGPVAMITLAFSGLDLQTHQVLVGSVQATVTFYGRSYTVWRTG